MTDINAPDIVSFSRLSRTIADIKDRADTTRIESVTGRRDDVTAATNGNVGGAHLLKKAVDDVRAYQDLLALSRTRTQLVQSALSAVDGEAVRLGGDTLAAIGRTDEAALATLSKDAEAAVTNVFSVLNITQGDRALFSGDATDRLPFGDPAQLIEDVRANRRRRRRCC